MPAGRQKFNFYAVTNGRETGVFTSWPQASDSVLGFANAKHKGFCKFSDAAETMVIAGLSDFNVFDGQNTYTRQDYENINRIEGVTATSVPLTQTTEEPKQDADVFQGESTCITSTENCKQPVITHITQQNTTHTVYIDGSCVRNGSTSAQAGYGLFWGDKHPWNCSIPLSAEISPTNNKAELRAAIKAVQVATENDLKELIVNSDSKYVISGITEWVQKWTDNGWKTSSGEQVKNKEEWTELIKLINSCKTNITWYHVPAHSGIAGNEEADKLALQAANGEPSDIQAKCTRKEAPRSTVTNNSENQTVLKVQPKVLVIEKKNCTSLTNQLQRHQQFNAQTTPVRKPTKDKSETPVPFGCVNGSHISQKKTEHQLKTTQNDHFSSMQCELTTKVTRNMESILENALF